MKRRSLILISAAAAFLLILSIGTLIKPDVEFSPDENRYLTQKPALSVNNLLDGSFESASEEYLSDQIIGRQKWVELKSLTEASAGINDINGVYLCIGGRAVERVTETDFDQKNYLKNLTQAAELADICKEQGISVNTMLVPTAAYVYADRLPDNALTFNEDEAFRQAEEILGDGLIDIRNSLIAAKQKEDVFFKTDHHWTGRGARIGAVEFLKAAGENSGAYRTANCGLETLSSEFRGTLYSKVLLKTIGTDIIETSADARNADIKVEIEGKEYNSLYFDEYLGKKDKYAVYFGGNYAEVDIMTGAAEDGQTSKEKLLIIKDSFANSMVPFLQDDFSEITMVDTRFYRGDISRLAEDYDRVLLVYSVNNFAKEKMVFTGSLLK
ncbi:MAG: DHHW family protein [Anaerovoracaceae bacterium]